MEIGGEEKAYFHKNRMEVSFAKGGLSGKLLRGVRKGVSAKGVIGVLQLYG